MPTLCMFVYLHVRAGQLELFITPNIDSENIELGIATQERSLMHRR